jgi:hypothetical protein
VELQSLIGKEIKATKPNGNFVIGVLKSINTTHAEIYDTRMGIPILVPLATSEFVEVRR